ncbi:uncharacterized protein BCR38DRAFT_412140 [Pseudomassariella vexata]|uniref:Uncharacterized protein n=1 Tax=Pseudomassariella vexata TaxID=1141098 RepID=A0A1Y2DKV6_9PEZI|nr:uncharacterized protein BCR38DRAFT_412140 [Pseudomassariella vexata]ORY59918.1 hypothetical protein BCR38DRAFT_412140 [Pseudomassariella vexata]
MDSKSCFAIERDIVNVFPWRRHAETIRGGIPLPNLEIAPDLIDTSYVQMSSIYRHTSHIHDLLYGFVAGPPSNRIGDLVLLLKSYQSDSDFRCRIACHIALVSLYRPSLVAIIRSNQSGTEDVARHTAPWILERATACLEQLKKTILYLQEVLSYYIALNPFGIYYTVLCWYYS